MADPVELAKTARTQLASALAALQSSAHVPEELMDLAEPIAEAMGILHQVERSQGAVLDRRDVALTNVRNVLDKLQRVGGNHPAIDVVTECVAASLSRVHTLSRYEPPAAAPPQDPFARTEPLARPSPFMGQMAPPPAPPPPPGYEAAPAAVMKTVPLAQPSPVVSAPQPAQGAGFQLPPQRQAAPAPHAAPAPAPHAAPAPAPQEAPAPALAGAVHVEVELGTHSDSNFYKGLGGNDVIEHGGIFVATYKIPKLGSPVVLRVLLPGDYEFHANAVVQWSRESTGAGDAPPGFGARITHVGADGKQLVYRYTRNREPIFYDDL